MIGKTAEDRAWAYRSFETLQNAGLSLEEILRQFVESASAKEQARIREVAGWVRRGARLSDAMEKTRFFRPAEVALIRVGEEAGRLAEATRALAERYEIEQQAVAELRRGVTRPILLQTLAAFIIPLPAVVNGDCTGARYLRVSVGSLALCAALVFLAARAWEQIRKDRAKLRVFLGGLSKIPYVGRVIEAASLDGFCSVFAIAVRSGLPLPRSFEVAGSVLSYERHEAGVQKILAKIRSGSKLLDALGSSGMFASDALLQLSVAETTGAVPEAFDRLGKRSREEFSKRLGDLMAILTRGYYAVIAAIIHYWIIALWDGLFQSVSSTIQSF